jgi:hypothetical protein
VIARNYEWQAPRHPPRLSFAAARAEKGWIATPAQTEFTSPRRRSDGLPRRNLAERRRRAPSPRRVGRGEFDRVAHPPLDVPDEVGRDRAPPSGGATGRRCTCSSQFSDRAAPHTLRLVSPYATAAQVSVTPRESGRFQIFAASSPSRRHQSGAPARAVPPRTPAARSATKD